MFNALTKGSCFGASLIQSGAADLGAQGVLLRQRNARTAKRHTRSQKLSWETLTRPRLYKSDLCMPMKSSLGNTSDQEKIEGRNFL